MGIVTEKQVVIRCDSCDDTYVEAGVRRPLVILMARQWGWMIRRTGAVVCPVCRKRAAEHSSSEAPANMPKNMPSQA